MAVCDEHIMCETLHARLTLPLSKQKEKRKPYHVCVIKYSEENLFITKIKIIHYHKFINKQCNWLLIKRLAANNVLHSQEFNNTILLIGLMAVCDEKIVYQSQHVLLRFGLSQVQKKT